MSVRIRLVRRLAATLAFGVAVGMSAPAFAGALGGKSGSKNPPPQPEPAAKGTQTRVFTPQNTEPAEVLRAIDELLDGVAALEQPPEPAGPAGGPGLPPGVPPGGTGKQPGFGQPPGGGGALGGFPQGFGMMGGAGGPLPGHAARLAMDKRTGSIIVRGPAKELQIAADLFKLLDTPRDEPLPEFKSLRAFPLKHAHASDVAALVGELEIGAAVLALDEAKLLVVVGPADAVREFAELVKSIDAPAKKAPDPEKRKKLFPAEKGG